MDVGNWISGSSAFSKPSLNIWKFMVHVLLKPGLENFEHYFASVEAIQEQGWKQAWREIPEIPQLPPREPPPSPAFPFPSSHHWWSPSWGSLHIHSQANLRIWLVFRTQRYSQWFMLVSREWCGKLWMENLGQSCDPYWKWKQNDQTKPTLKNSYLREETSLLNVCSQSTPFCWGHY